MTNKSLLSIGLYTIPKEKNKAQGTNPNWSNGPH